METTGTLGNYVEINDQKIELEGVTLLHLNEIRKWAKFLAVFGYIGVGILLLLGVLMIAATSFHSSFQMDQFGILGPWIGVSYIVLAVISFFPTFYLYRFASNAKHSLVQIGSVHAANTSMAEAIHYLKKHFRYIGIFTLTFLCIYLVVAIGVLIAVAIR